MGTSLKHCVHAEQAERGSIAKRKGKKKRSRTVVPTKQLADKSAFDFMLNDWCVTSVVVYGLNCHICENITCASCK